MAETTRLKAAADDTTAIIRSAIERIDAPRRQNVRRINFIDKSKSHGSVQEALRSHPGFLNKGLDFG